MATRRGHCCAKSAGSLPKRWIAASSAGCPKASSWSTKASPTARKFSATGRGTQARSGPVDYTSDLRIDSSLDITPELQAQILEFEASLDKALLRVARRPRDADTKQIKRAYFSLSKVYHPDRYFRANLGDYSVRLERIFRKLVEAYELLSDPATRAEIERTMGAMPEPEPEPVAEASEAGAAPKRKLPPRKLTKRQTLERLRRHFRIPPQILAERKLKASQFFEAAMVAAKRERWHEAAPSLRLAIAFDPWNDEYRTRFSDILSHHYEQRAAKLLDSDGEAIDPAAQERSAAPAGRGFDPPASGSRSQPSGGAAGPGHPRVGACHGVRGGCL